MSFNSTHSNDGMPARRIDHVGIATRDADAAAQWYIDTLLMEIVGDEIVPAAGVRLMYLAPRGLSPDAATMLQMVEPVAPGAVADFVAERGEGMHHVCFAVDSLEEVLAELGQSASTLFRAGRERMACFLGKQPNQVRIELTETHPSGPAP